MSLTTTILPEPVSRFSNLLRLVRLPCIWMERRNQRVALAELDDHLIADIGRQRCEVDREYAKPFWQA